MDAKLNKALSQLSNEIEEGKFDFSEEPVDRPHKDGDLYVVPLRQNPDTDNEEIVGHVRFTGQYWLKVAMRIMSAGFVAMGNTIEPAYNSLRSVAAGDFSHAIDFDWSAGEPLVLTIPAEHINERKAYQLRFAVGTTEAQADSASESRSNDANELAQKLA